LLTPSTGAVTGAPSRGGRSHPPGRAPCRPPCPPRTGALRGGVTAPPVGVAPRQWAAAAAVAAAPPLFLPHAPPATATWQHVPPCVLTAIETAGVPGIDASPSAPAPGSPGYCTHVPGIATVGVRDFWENGCRVVLEGCQVSLRSVIDWFYTAPKQFKMIASSPKGVLHDQRTSRFVYNGCYLCVFMPPKGA